MTNTNMSPSPIVRIQFGNLDTFCDELASRGPNVEPIVRICQQVRPGHSDTHGPLPIEHVFGHVSYLRRIADVLHLTVLHLYLGQRWIYNDNTPDRAEVRARIDELYERIRNVCQILELALVDGSVYQGPAAQP
jgi:hypothetical protein